MMLRSRDDDDVRVALCRIGLGYTYSNVFGVVSIMHFTGGPGLQINGLTGEDLMSFGRWL